jgi:glycosyltransferase involved in cell wall biosynthesis
MIKKLIRKFRVSTKVLAEQGVLGFLIVCLQFLQKHTRKSKSSISNSQGKIYTKARYKDIISSDIFTVRKKWQGTDKKKLTFNWIMPPPGKGSGGHLNIFRFIEFLEKAGHECRIYMYVSGVHGPVSGVRAIMGDSYPKLKATSSMRWLDEDNTMEQADGIFATSWETAYASFNTKIEAKRFYFVQDFEPYFYPVGSFYSFAENTYKLGFFGVTAGGWLSKKLREEYGMKTAHYNFGCDKSMYTYVNSDKRKEILFYVRPYTERRGFETGVMALDLFHKKHPDFKINLVGWDVSEYDIPFPYTNLKTLELNQLNELYNRCAAGLVMSFTNMSLLPLELLGSGSIPVVNKADNNVLVSNNPYIAYAENDPVSLARVLSETVSRDNLPAYASEASESVEGTTWEDAGRTFLSIIEEEIKSHE